MCHSAGIFLEAEPSFLVIVGKLVEPSLVCEFLVELSLISK